MKVTTKFREEKDGWLKLEWRFTAEGQRPSNRMAYDDEGDMCDMQARGVADRAKGWGKPMIVIIREYVGPPQREARNDMDLILLDDNREGVGGNSNPDWATHAFGLRRVLDVHVTGSRSKRVVVVLGRDIAEDRP